MLRIKYERLKRGWSQAALGELAGFTQPAISLFEDGRLIPTPDEQDRLGQVFQITPPSVLFKPVSVRDPEETTAS